MARVAGVLASWLGLGGTPLQRVTGIVRADSQAHAPIDRERARECMWHIVRFGRAVVDARDSWDLDLAGHHLAQAARVVGVDVVVEVLLGQATVVAPYRAAPMEEAAPKAVQHVLRPEEAMRLRTSAARPAARRAQTKAERWWERKALIVRGRGAAALNPKQAAERLARNNVAVEKARLTKHVYDPASPVPEGWRNVSGDAAVLERFGLKVNDFQSKSTDFRVQFYEPERAIFGDDLKPSVVFKGTEMTSLMDWANNAAQALNRDSAYYRRAVNIGIKLRQTILPVDVAGHSLGGGLCAAASSASGKDCWSFNAAGLHPDTVVHYGAAPQSSRIYAYHVQDEILTAVQRQTALPQALGTPYPLPGEGSPIGRHGIDQVINGIEKQKEEDVSTLRTWSTSIKEI